MTEICDYMKNLVAAHCAALCRNCGRRCARFAPADLGNRAEFRIPNSDVEALVSFDLPLPKSFRSRNRSDSSPNRATNACLFPPAQEVGRQPVTVTRTQRSQSAVGETSGPRAVRPIRTSPGEGGRTLAAHAKSSPPGRSQGGFAACHCGTRRRF